MARSQRLVRRRGGDLWRILKRNARRGPNGRGAAEGSVSSDGKLLTRRDRNATVLFDCPRERDIGLADFVFMCTLHCGPAPQTDILRENQGGSHGDSGSGEPEAGHGRVGDSRPARRGPIGCGWRGFVRAARGIELMYRSRSENDWCTRSYTYRYTDYSKSKATPPMRGTSAERRPAGPKRYEMVDFAPYPGCVLGPCAS